MSDESLTTIVVRSMLLGMLMTGAGCGSTANDDGPPAPSARRDRDMHSFARPAEARVTHVALDLRADFDARVLSGRATLSLERAPGAREVVVDTRDLTIEGVQAPDGTRLDFSLGAADEHLGQPLTVTLPEGVREVVVAYRTSPGAAALQWLQPAQTAGRTQPYLYSQGQAILTRTWIPTQDSPGIRQTYSARITVPRTLRAVMSAEQLTPEGVDGPDGRRFEFRL